MNAKHLRNCILPILLLLASCSYKPQLVNMIYDGSSFAENSTGKSIRVLYTSGGNIGAGSIENQDFNLALVHSLRVSKFFTEVFSSGEEGDYRLQTQILGQDQPAMGFDMTVKLTVAYYIYKGSTEEKIYENIITSVFTAGAGEAFAGAKRLNIANEGAVKDNIKQFIYDIAQKGL